MSANTKSTFLANFASVVSWSQRIKRCSSSASTKLIVVFRPQSRSITWLVHSTDEREFKFRSHAFWLAQLKLKFNSTILLLRLAKMSRLSMKEGGTRRRDHKMSTYFLRRGIPLHNTGAFFVVTSHSENIRTHTHACCTPMTFLLARLRIPKFHRNLFDHHTLERSYLINHWPLINSPQTGRSRGPYKRFLR